MHVLAHAMQYSLGSPGELNVKIGVMVKKKTNECERGGGGGWKGGKADAQRFHARTI
jgi:hypothetical protein